ncbi:hypothetical protein OG225_32295 [Nocardia sp. NBC_01377]|uniref:hypothetical protein n=1 Tax=Nocardia sp. NBC_01377 TaxID=2903595 RepID=UPI00324FC425
MTRTIIRNVFATIGTAAALTGAVVAGTGVAAAVDVPSRANVRYVFCSDEKVGNEIIYYDELGKRDEVVTLAEHTDGGLWCRNVDVQFKSRSFTWSAIANEDAHYAYTAIYVNGKMAAREEDRSDFGHASAQAM